jgi:hypothetical protein
LSRLLVVAIRFRAGIIFLAGDVLPDLLPEGLLRVGHRIRDLAKVAVRNLVEVVVDQLVHQVEAVTRVFGHAERLLTSLLSLER